MRCVAGASVATGHAVVNVRLPLRACLRERESVGRPPNAVGRRGATFAFVAVSGQFVGKYACTVGKQELCSCCCCAFFGVDCSRAESVIIRGCRCKVGLIWFVLIVPML